MTYKPKHASTAQAADRGHTPKHAAETTVKVSKISGKPSGIASLAAMRGDWNNG